MAQNHFVPLSQPAELHAAQPGRRVVPRPTTVPSIVEPIYNPFGLPVHATSTLRNQPPDFTGPHPQPRAATDSMPQQEAQPGLKSDDDVIAVMGVTGVGKSTFISYFSDTATVGEGLESCTQEVEIHKANIDGKLVWLIDTPGFDDTNRQDTDVLRDIADWLNTSYQSNFKLAGIVYLHDISSDRFKGADTRSLRLFNELCGHASLSSVVIATTKWRDDIMEKSIRNELHLKDKFWGKMISAGTTVLRQDNGRDSALAIIRHILTQRRRQAEGMNLQIQLEMINGNMQLHQTSAGIALQQELKARMAKMQEDHARDMLDLRRDMRDAQRENDRQKEEQMRQEIQGLSQSFTEAKEKNRRDMERLHVTHQQLHKEREEALNAALSLAEDQLKAKRRELVFSTAKKNAVAIALADANVRAAEAEAEKKRYKRKVRKAFDDSFTCVVM